MMKYQVTILLLAGLVAYANAAISGATACTLKIESPPGTTIAAGGTVSVGDTLKMTCDASAADEDPDKAVFLRGTDVLKDETGTVKVKSIEYTLVDGDIGDATTYKCHFAKAAAKTQEPSQSLKVVAATTTAAPTTTMAGGGGDGKSGAGSNSPVIAIFLISIAAMCF